MPPAPPGHQNLNADFCIEIRFIKGSPNPSRVFDSMSRLIEAFQEVDRDLVKSIDIDLQPILVLEDIEAGSLRTWLRYALNEIDDDALKNLDWKPAVGKYLVKAKYILIDFLNDKTTVSNRQELIGLSERLLSAARESDILNIPTYAPLPPVNVADAIRRLTAAVEPLDREHDRVRYITGEAETDFNMSISVTPETLENLLTREIISNEQRMILKVKKPDYLGASMWDFRFEDRTIHATVSDGTWLSDFQSRKIDVRPGDALRAIVMISVRYGFDGDVVGVHYDVVKVEEVIQVESGGQSQLF